MVVSICFLHIYKYCLLLQLKMKMIVAPHFDYRRHASCSPILLMNIHRRFCLAKYKVVLCPSHLLQACLFIMLSNGVSFYGLQIPVYENYVMNVILILLYFGCSEFPPSVIIFISHFYLPKENLFPHHCHSPQFVLQCSPMLLILVFLFCC